MKKMPASSFLRMNLAWRMQQRAPLQLFLRERRAPGGLSNIRSGAALAANGFAQPPQSTKSRIAADQLRSKRALAKSSGSSRQKAGVFFLPNVCTGDNVSTHTGLIDVPVSSLASLSSSSRKGEGQGNSFAHGDSSTNGLNNTTSITSNISNRMVSSTLSTTGTIANSPRGSLNSIAYSAAVAKMECATRWFSYTSKESRPFFNERETGKDTAAYNHENVGQESGEAQTAAVSPSFSAEEGRREKKEEERTSSQERSSVSPDVAISPPHRSSKKNTSAAASSGSPSSSESNPPLRLIRVNRSGSARRSGVSETCSSVMTTCSSSERGSEAQKPGVGETQGKGNLQATQRTTSKEMDSCYTTNSKEEEIPSSPEIHGQAEEFGFKYKGPEPTTYGDWSHNGRVTDF